MGLVRNWDETSSSLGSHIINQLSSSISLPTAENTYCQDTTQVNAGSREITAKRGDRNPSGKLAESIIENTASAAFGSVSAANPSAHCFHLYLRPIHLVTYTSVNNTGTSINGPTVDARA